MKNEDQKVVRKVSNEMRYQAPNFIQINKSKHCISNFHKDDSGKIILKIDPVNKILPESIRNE